MRLLRLRQVLEQCMRPQDKVFQRSRQVGSANALENLLFVRFLAHTDVLVEGAASGSLSFSRKRSCALEAALGCRLVRAFYQMTAQICDSAPESLGPRAFCALSVLLTLCLLQHAGHFSTMNLAVEFQCATTRYATWSLPRHWSRIGK